MSPALPRLPRRGLSSALPFVCLGLGLTWTTPAEAYCRTTTCIPSENCEYDPVTGCAVNGTFLEWKRSCVSFSVQQDGSPRRGIDYEEAHSIIAGAFANWLDTSCPGGRPSLDIADLGAVSCNAPQYNQSGPNANVWMFRDDAWESDRGFAGAAELAITIVTYHPDTGEIYDADVEINSHQIPITIGDENVQYDLASIVTHEAGHFLGLSHSRVLDSVMRVNYLPGTTSLRQLAEDDREGICAIYPPDREVPNGNCTPRHGFTSACYRPNDGGCSIASQTVGRAPPLPRWAFAALALLAASTWVRRRGSFRCAR